MDRATIEQMSKLGFVFLDNGDDPMGHYFTTPGVAGRMVRPELGEGWSAYNWKKPWIGPSFPSPIAAVIQAEIEHWGANDDHT